MSGGKFLFTWSIENFFSYFFESEEKLISPEFMVESFKNTKWVVFFSKSNVRLSNNKYIYCVLHRLQTCAKPEKLEISYNVELIGSFRKLYSSSRTVTKEFTKGDWAKIISDTCIGREILLDNKSSGDVLTIRLEMLNQEFNGTSDTECIARTKIGGDMYSFECKLGEKSFPQLKTFPCFQGMQVSLEVDSAPDDSAKVVIKRLKRNSESRFLQCKISFVDVDGTKMGSKKCTGWFRSYESEWEFFTTITKNFLKCHNFVTLLCECHVSNGTLSTELKYIQSDASVSESSVHTLQDDFQRMYLEKILSDVKLRVADEIFLAHKCVLCSRSPVFLAMFSQNMEEKQTSFVVIHDTDPKIFAIFLKFLYIGEAEFDGYEDALNLLLCADKYQVTSLKEHCSSYLLQDLCEKNACRILVVADLVEMKLLKSSTIRRIKAHALRIFKSADWNQVLEHHPKLASEVLSILSSEFCH